MYYVLYARMHVYCLVKVRGKDCHQRNAIIETTPQKLRSTI